MRFISAYYPTWRSIARWRSGVGIAVIAVYVLLQLQGCTSLPDNTDRSQSSAPAHTVYTRLGGVVQAELKRHPGESGFWLLDDGLDAFVARAALASQADRSIDLQYYLYVTLN